jgi:hypothetical protein
MWNQMFTTQRAIVDEMVLANRDNIRFLDREAERDERVDRNDEYGYYEEDDEFNDELREDRREARRERRQQRVAS